MKVWINLLNVFPEPDGDTGTNMTMTIMAAAAEVGSLGEPDMESLAKAISSGSLRGARGNSGVILSQLLRGFTMSVKTKEDLDTLGIKTFFCSNVCSAYRRSEYDAMGGFEHKTIFNEDMIMASKMIEDGKAVAYQADARVWHWHDYKAIQQLHRNFDLAVSQVDHGGLFLKVRSESEGVKMGIATIKHLFKKGKQYLIPKYVIDTGFKLIGYKLGRNYKKLPKWMVLKLTMNQTYWKA